MVRLNGAPGEIRTPDLLIRSQSLYPAELRAHTGGLQDEAHEPLSEYQGQSSGARLERPSRHRTGPQIWSGGAMDLRRRRGRSCRCGRWKNRLFFCINLWRDFKPCLADQFGDRGGVEARGIVFDAKGAGGSVEAQLPDSIYIARVGQRQRYPFRGRRSVSIDDIYSRHEFRITVDHIPAFSRRATSTIRFNSRSALQ